MYCYFLQMINSQGICAQTCVAAIIQALPRIQKHHPSIKRRNNKRQSLTAVEFDSGKEGQKGPLLSLCESKTDWNSTFLYLENFICQQTQKQKRFFLAFLSLSLVINLPSNLPDLGLKAVCHKGSNSQQKNQIRIN